VLLHLLFKSPKPPFKYRFYPWQLNFRFLVQTSSHPNDCISFCPFFPLKIRWFFLNLPSQRSLAALPPLFFSAAFVFSIGGGLLSFFRLLFYVGEVFEFKVRVSPSVSKARFVFFCPLFSPCRHFEVVCMPLAILHFFWVGLSPTSLGV